MKTDYDPKKFDMDEYGNLIPKEKHWKEYNKDKLDNTTNVKMPKTKK